MRFETIRSTRLLGTSSHVRRQFVAVAAMAATVDLVTKAIAVRALGETGHVEITDRLALMVAFNTGGAGGITVGPFTWHLNVLVTCLAVALIAWVVQSMAAVDARSTRALGLVAGGAIGNLASMLFGPTGVADFIAVRLTGDTVMIANLADVSLWVGAALLAPVVLVLLRLVRAERAGLVRVQL